MLKRKQQSLGYDLEYRRVEEDDGFVESLHESAKVNNIKDIKGTIATLAKTSTNRKKVKQYLIDTVGMPMVQAEELTIYTFDKRVW